MTFDSEQLSVELPHDQQADRLFALAEAIEDEATPLNRAEIAFEVREAAEKLKELGDKAYTDSLTGLASAAFFKEFIEPKLTMFSNGERRAGSPDTYLIGIADLNDLKHVNESIDYAAGDEFIKWAAKTIKRVLRPEDIVTRHSDRADEFILVLPITGISENVFDTIYKIIGNRLNEKGQRIAVGFVSLVDYPTLEAALSAVQVNMLKDKTTRKQGKIAVAQAVEFDK